MARQSHAIWPSAPGSCIRRISPSRTRTLPWLRRSTRHGVTPPQTYTSDLQFLVLTIYITRRHVDTRHPCCTADAA